MKQTLLRLPVTITLLSIMLMFNSCAKLALRLFEGLDYDISLDMTINPISTVGAVSKTNVDRTLDIKKIIEENAGSLSSYIRVEDLTSIEVTKAELIINNATQSNNFSNMASGKITVITNSCNGVIVSSSIPDSYTNRIIWDIPKGTVNLKNCFTNTVNVTYSYETTVRRPTTIPLNCTLNLKFHFE